MTTTHSPPVPDKPAAEPPTTLPNAPPDDALRVSSLELQTGLQVSDVAETLTTEDFNSLFGGTE